MAFIYNLTDTWNSGATTFAAIKMNVTDTSSAAGSLLLDLGTGGGSYSSKFAVFKNGGIANGGLRLGNTDAAAAVAQTISVQSVVAGTSNTAGANLTIAGSQGTGSGAGGSIVFQVSAAGAAGTNQNSLATALTINSDRVVTFAGRADALQGLLISGNFGGNNANWWSSGGLNISTIGTITFNNDLIIARDAANTLAMRNGAAAQELRIYGSYTSAAVYDRLALKSSTTVATVAAETDSGDMDLALTPAGAGNVRFGTHAAIAAETLSGYITIKDAGGTPRKIAVIS